MSPLPTSHLLSSRGHRHRSARRLPIRACQSQRGRRERSSGSRIPYLPAAFQTHVLYGSISRHAKLRRTQTDSPQASVSMRQRRSTTLRSANGSNRNSHNQPLSTPASAINSKTASVIITVISGIFGFVVSTFILLLIWSSNLPDTSRKSTNNVQSNLNDGSPHWEWHRYSGITGNSSRFGRKTCLIVQVSIAKNPGHLSRDYLSASTSYDMHEVLKTTSKINRAYAKKWHYDHVKITLPHVMNRDDDPSLPENEILVPSLRTKQYIEILRDLLKIGLNETRYKPDTNQTTYEYSYDFVWIFNDPSMMIVNFEKNVFDHADFLVAGLSQYASQEDTNYLEEQDQNTLTYMHLAINEGALLWSLKNQFVSNLLDSWELYNDLRSALSSLTHIVQPTPIWNEILDDTSTIYHFPVMSEALHSYTTINEKTGQSSDTRGQKILIPVNRTQEKIYNKIGQERLQMRTKDTIKLQSVADLVCFRYFPSCDVL